MDKTGKWHVTTQQILGEGHIMSMKTFKILLQIGCLLCGFLILREVFYLMVGMMNSYIFILYYILMFWAGYVLKLLDDMDIKEPADIQVTGEEPTINIITENGKELRIKSTVKLTPSGAVRRVMYNYTEPGTEHFTALEQVINALNLLPKEEVIRYLEQTIEMGGEIEYKPINKTS